jgi:hypothetical protein
MYKPSLKNPIPDELFNFFIYPICDHLLPTIQETIRSEISYALKESTGPRILTRHQVAKKLNISLQTVDNWRKIGKLTEHRIEGSKKVFFKEEDVLNELKPLYKYQRPVFYTTGSAA